MNDSSVEKHEVLQLAPGDIQALRGCYEVFSCLRPHLDEGEFIRRVSKQREEGYDIAYIESSRHIVAASGYRIAHFLAWGKVLYIDDLITRPDCKRQGLGGALLYWLVERGRQLGCDEVHLDTGYQRHDAHRLYLKSGFTLGAHHVSLKL